MFSIFSVAFYHRIWNPILLFVVMLLIGVILSIGECSSKNFQAAVFWIVIGEMFFVIAFICAQIIFKRRGTVNLFCPVAFNLKIVNMLVNLNLIVSILALFVGIYSVMQVAPNFISIFTNSTYVRELYLRRSGNTIITIIGIFLSLNFFVTFCFVPIALQYHVKKIVPKLTMILLIRLFNSIVTMSKEAFIIDAIYFVSVYILLLKDKKEEYKFYRKYGTVFGILVIVLLIVISFQRNYIGQRKYSGYGNAVLGTLREYISIPIEAFGALLNLNSIEYTKGNLCFRPIINILSYIGIGEHVSIIQDVVTDVTSSNVYTLFGNMYRDFSYVGIVGLSILFGFFLGTIYKSNHKNRISRIIADSIVIMVMFFGYYDLIIIQTVYLLVIVYAVIFDKIIAAKLYVNCDSFSFRKNSIIEQNIKNEEVKTFETYSSKFN
ncbi:O-antigen polymerase [Blautia sp. MSJ-9]|uniref:O-antigen polymerase n=1 Tax=Blautia sp. MSJ-9 TaxID=2841511 RepID=UPI002110E7D8|nr:O-antigen polymerase [Blautia sp. MSJ-9]